MPLITNEWQVFFLVLILFQWELDESIHLHVLSNYDRRASGSSTIDEKTTNFLPFIVLSSKSNNASERE
ncbi:hypothetical protein ABFS83_05G108100 [Erythranthe nasuta]